MQKVNMMINLLLNNILIRFFNLFVFFSGTGTDYIYISYFNLFISFILLATPAKQFKRNIKD